MRKIIYNQARWNFADIKEKLSEIYDMYVKSNGTEKDVLDVVKFSMEYYRANNVFPGELKIEENFKFGFDDYDFGDPDGFSAYLRDKVVDLRDRNTKEIYLKLMTGKLPAEKRLELLDEVVRITTDVFNDEVKTVTKFEDMSAREDYALYKNKGSGIKTNIPDLDAATQGISSGKIMVVFAPPGGFKTSFALNMMYLNVMEGDNTLFLSLEIPKNEAHKMLLVRHSWTMGANISMLKVMKGMLTPQEEEALYAVEADFNAKRKGTFVFLDTDDLHLDSTLSFKVQIRDIIKANNITSAYLDFIQQFKDFDIKGITDEKILMNKIVSILRYISVTDDVRWIILSQANRAGMEYADRNEGSMKLTNISEINNLERYGYYILSLYSNDEMKLAGQLKFGLIKHRGGETMQEARNTNVIPQYFVVGDTGNTQQDMLGYQAAIDSGGFDIIQIFDNGAPGASGGMEGMTGGVDFGASGSGE